MNIEHILSYHNDYLNGGTGFSDHGSKKRYQEILELIGYNQTYYDSILEVGCGPYGGLYEYTGGFLPRYFGIDINPEYIKKSIEVTKQECLFKTANILTRELEDDETYDHVIASGIFCYDYPGAEEVNQSIINEMVAHCNKTVIANFIPVTVPNLEEVHSKKILTYSLTMLSDIIYTLPDEIGYKIIADKYKNNITLHLKRYGK